MPLARYGVLAGRVAGRRAEGGTDTPHYQVHVRGGGADYRVAVNVLSREHPSELLYLADEAFDHPLVQQLPALPDGCSELPSAAGGLALDGGVQPAGEAVRATPGSTVQLGNRGGLVTLLDPEGLKVDGVAYTKSQAAAEGWSVVFR